MKRNVRVFTIVYGDKFVQRYLEFALPSTLQPNNVPALIRDHDVRIRLYTTAQSVDQLQRGLRAALRRREDGDALSRLFKIVTIEVETDRNAALGHESSQPSIEFNRKFQNASVFREIEASLADDSVTLVVTADGFVGNGSFRHAVCESLARDACVAAPYMRVDTERFRAALSRETWPIENDQLAAISLLSLLDIGRSLVRGGRRHLTYLLGADIVPISARLFSVSLGFPNVLAARFKPSDLAYFKLHNDFRNWDATWPQKLIAERRFVYVGSSDLAYHAELMDDSQARTDSYVGLDDHFAKLVDTREFMRYGLHNEVMRNLSICMRTDRDVVLQAF